MIWLEKMVDIHVRQRLDNMLTDGDQTESHSWWTTCHSYFDNYFDRLHWSRCSDRWRVYERLVSSIRSDSMCSRLILNSAATSG